MIKILVLCAFLACAFATRNWAGYWQAANEISIDFRVCDVPDFLSIAKITANGSNLILEGMSANDASLKTWTLDWSDDEQGYSYCSSDDWCVAGYLIYENGNTFANITWHLSDQPTTWCSSLLTPIELNWVGRWFVYQSQPDAYCPVPQLFVNIEAYGDQLLMIGHDSVNDVITSWTLNFTAQQQHVWSCVEPISSCVQADLAYSDSNILESVIYGNLSWVNDNFYTCNATLVKFPPHFEGNSNNLDYQEVEKLLSRQPESLIA